MGKSSMSLPISLKNRWRSVAIGLLGTVFVPFFITGMYRLTSDEVPGAPLLPVELVAVMAAVTWHRWRALSVGLLVGIALWAVFLFWLISSFGLDS